VREARRLALHAQGLAAALQMRNDRVHALAQAQYFEAQRAQDVAAAGVVGLDPFLVPPAPAGQPRTLPQLRHLGPVEREEDLLERRAPARELVQHDRRRGCDLADALERTIFGAFYQSGQSCIGVQRILIHDEVYDEFRDMLIRKTKSLVAGDPKDRNVFIGPMIDVKEAQRLDHWIQDAIEKGAKLLCGGKRDGAMLEATLLEDVDPATDLNREEAFGPVAFLIRFSDFNDALDIVNDSKFGLQAGIFTRDLFQMFDAWDRLEVGGVVINDVPSYRVDNMPYGGVKDSGLGREGIRFAMEDMTEIRNLVIRRRDEGPAKKHMGA